MKKKVKNYSLYGIIILLLILIVILGLGIPRVAEGNAKLVCGETLVMETEDDYRCVKFALSGNRDTTCGFNASIKCRTGLNQSMVPEPSSGDNILCCPIQGEEVDTISRIKFECLGQENRSCRITFSRHN